MEAISHAGTCVGIVGTDGIVLAAERKITTKLLESVTSDKMFRIDKHIACAVAGITADANILISNARVTAQRHLFAYQEEVPVEQLVRGLCDLKQSYTQFGGLRPFGVSLLYAGWDQDFGLQLYQSDPSGNYGGWKATAIGNNHQAAQSILKQDYDPEKPPTLDEALKLAVKILSKTMDSTQLSAEKLEFAVVKPNEFHILTTGELTRLIASVELEPKKE